MAKKHDIDGYYNALRPRLARSALGGTTSAPTTVAPHHHHASEIFAEPEPISALLSADDVQEGMEELGQEKLARTGEQEWIGPNPLNMNSFALIRLWNLTFNGGVGDAIVNLVRQITMTGLGLIEQVRKIDFTGSAITEGIIDQPRVIHMAGDHVDDEAKVDGLERVVFNDEPTASSIEMPSRLDMNIAVEAGVSYTAAEGRASWDSLEDTFGVYVVSGAGVVFLALGWGVTIATNGYSPA